jgi:RNA polymerase sigma-70 factor (family 1)
MLRYNERELIMQVSEGNQKAFRQLFDHHWDNIFSVALAFTKSTELSEELVQDVFLKIWLKRAILPSIEKFDAYLFIIARNHIYNELRKKIVHQPFVEQLQQCFQESSALPEQQLLLKETKQLIDKAVTKLPTQQRTVFELSRNEGLDNNKIAEKLGISKLTVKSHMTKALKFIRSYYQMNTEGLLLVIIIFKSYILKLP